MMSDPCSFALGRVCVSGGFGAVAGIGVSPIGGSGSGFCWEEPVWVVVGSSTVSAA